jgi:dihydroorotate dehydrogenase electron transfer subunit
MWLSCPPVARGAAPGRFLMLHCGDADDPLLARPMSFHRFRQSTQGPPDLAILYDVRGRGTALLSQKRPGDVLPVFGPLGKGYTLRPQSQHVLLVAGGLGVAAVVALADDAVASGKSVTLLHGARTAAALVPPSMLPSEVELMTATDDGSGGHHGYVTQLLAEHLPWADQVFACGPNPMFASMADEMRKIRSRKPVQALLEERMGCGTGVCYGCAVFSRKGVRLVCRDGPRFELREVFP